jgi:hypothetical protein
MTRVSRLLLVCPGALLLLAGFLAVSSTPAGAQEAPRPADRLAPPPSPETGTLPGLDPERDLSVSFRTKHEGGDDAGSVFGMVTNSSRLTYPCARIEFQLLTRYDRRETGKGSTSLGTFQTDVRNVQPGAKTEFRASLPRPAGVRLGSVGLCETAPVEEAEGSAAAEATIVSFEARPAAINPGETVRLYWDVQGADEVLLFDDFGPLESRITLPSGDLGWPESMNGAQQETLSKTTTFTLAAVSEAGRVTKTFTVNVQGKVIQ